MHIQLYVIEVWLVQYPFQLRFIFLSIGTFSKIAEISKYLWPRLGQNERRSMHFIQQHTYGKNSDNIIRSIEFNGRKKTNLCKKEAVKINFNYSSDCLIYLIPLLYTVVEHPH